jgi:hypothetical protein
MIMVRRWMTDHPRDPDEQHDEDEHDEDPKLHGGVLVPPDAS